MTAFPGKRRKADRLGLRRRRRARRTLQLEPEVASLGTNWMVPIARPVPGQPIFNLALQMPTAAAELRKVATPDP